MTLRLRLVAALLALAAVGLTVFGWTTYTFYARSQYRQLDDQLRSSVPAVSQLLTLAASGRPDTLPEAFGDRGLHMPSGLPLGTYAELRGPRGTTSDGVTQLIFGREDDAPDLPDVVTPGTSGPLFTTDSVAGGTDWRVLVTESSDVPGYVLVVAAPTSSVDRALDRLVAIEATAGLGLLAVLALGAWLILRRGLRPLEQMAATAGDITAGDLSPRVAPADDRSEVGQLGLALNTMLDELEAGFRQRDETEERLRQFLADAAHELRTPLTSIRGFAELFGLEDAGGRERDHVDTGVILRRIEQESARMSSLVDDLLLLAHLDQTRPVERAPVDLAVLAADACSDAVAADPTRPVSLDAPDPVVVEGNADHLRQAIANLMTNALRHTPAGTPVEVRVAEEGPPRGTADATAAPEAAAGPDLAGPGGRRAVVEVRDHGPGLDDEALVHAFDRFWRADPSRSGDATGLGLSIVAGIAAEHGGTAEGTNAPDGGAVFRLHLPL